MHVNANSHFLYCLFVLAAINVNNAIVIHLMYVYYTLSGKNEILSTTLIVSFVINVSHTFTCDASNILLISLLNIFVSFYIIIHIHVYISYVQR